MKVAVEEIARFMNEGWPGDDWYMEDEGPGWEENFDLESHSTYDSPRVPGAIVDDKDFQCAILWQGQGDDPSPHGDGYIFTSLFRKWRKAQTVSTLVVEVHKDKVETLTSFIKAAGGKIISK